MELELHDILKIHYASVQLKGLTVITGENNSGKSTIGKVLFSLLKATNNVRQVDKFKTDLLIRQQLEMIGRMLMRRFSITGKFNRPEQELPLLKDIPALSMDLISNVVSIDDVQTELEKAARQMSFTPRDVSIVREHCKKIRLFLISLTSPEKALKEEFTQISQSEFQEGLCSFGSNFSRITFHDDTADAAGSRMEVEINNNTINHVSLMGYTSLKDVTYVESPLYMHILDALRMADTISPISSRKPLNPFARIKAPYHLVDMADKLASAPDTFSLPPFDDNEYVSQLLRIKELTGGAFSVDSKTKRLTFKEGTHELPPVSVASGIKSFGVLQRLLQGGYLSPFRLLIWDEPEIHLHPQWQVEFCELIVELVSLGIPIVVSTHSPYFLQGLRYFAAKRGVEQSVTYYAPKQNPDGNLCDFEDVTDNLNEVFTLLAAPLQEIMNVDEARNTEQ